MNKWTLIDNKQDIIHLPNGGFIRTRRINDKFGAFVSIIEISNGSLLFTLLPERGLDIGELYLREHKISWDRSEDYLLHPSNVDLKEDNGTGWMKGFYAAVAAIGPELFGTPGEGFTLHGSGSYSFAIAESTQVNWDHQAVSVQAKVHVKDCQDHLLFEKNISIQTYWGSSLLLREEVTTNMSNEEKVLDDGYHIQLSGAFMYRGGRYVLPVKRQELLLRDSAPAEENPLHIPSFEEGPYPMRCYQYVPRAVDGLDQLPLIAPYFNKLNASHGLTAEMIVNTANSYAGVVIRPVVDFPRSLIAKRIDDSFMFAIEPCKTRPNIMSQKIIDGEVLYVQPGEAVSSSCIIGCSNSSAEIEQLEQFILSSV